MATWKECPRQLWLLYSRYDNTPQGVPGTPYLTAWSNSGKSGRERALRLMAIRQARLEPLAFSASGHEGAVNGWTATTEGKRRICPMEVSVR